MPHRRAHRAPEQGFALILAILSLLVLTFLGLTLATTTSTELQIANNYRNQQQAIYNAEAGLELAKRFLRQQTWSIVLPAARNAATMATCYSGFPNSSCIPTWTLSRPDAAGGLSRNWENWECDYTNGYQGVGYGVVLDHTNFAYPFQNVSTYFGRTISGSFTVWVKRPIKVNASAATTEDDPTDSNITITAEGTAPYKAGASSLTLAIRGRAVRVVQVDLKKVDPADCENDFTGQVGMGSLNANYDPCGKVTGAGLPSGSGATVTETAAGINQ